MRSAETNRSLLATLIGQRAKHEGGMESLIPGVRFFRASRSRSKTFTLYEPVVVFVAQGRKQMSLSGKRYTCDSSNYLVVSVPLPCYTEVEVPAQGVPYLAMSISVDTTVLSKLIIEMDGGKEPTSEALQVGIYSSPISDELWDAAVRLLQSMDNPTDRKILGSLHVREILYRVLGGSQGQFLRAVAIHNGRYHQIAEILNRIHARPEDPIDVPNMAAMAGMSESSFYRNFKAVASLSPLQYLKKIRLLKARSLMLYEGLNVGESAYRVGYNSASQFSREFRRLFGVPPTEEIAQVQTEG